MIKVFLGILLIIGCLAVREINLWLNYHPSSEQIIFIPPKTSLAQANKIICNTLSLPNCLPVKILTRYHTLNSRKFIHTGEYLITQNISLNNLISNITNGKALEHKLTIPDGLIGDQIAQILKDNKDLEGEIDPSLISEGLLMPDTYYYRKGHKRNDLLKKMHTTMQKFLNYEWSKRSPNLPFKTPYEALVLASIVEKETILATEQPTIAGVFINRLNKKMPLGSDPTVTYGLYKMGLLELAKINPVNVSYAQLAIKNPHSTYKNYGLPPTPICNPGRGAILAVLHPQSHEYLYFIGAANSNYHLFSATFEGHKQNKFARRRILTGS